MKTEFEYGREYAEWGNNAGEEGFDKPVDISAELTRSSSIPEEDYATMRCEGIDNPDARKYWEGFNSLFAHKAAAMLGRKGGQAKSERKTESSRANGKKGGRPLKPTLKCEICGQQKPRGEITYSKNSITKRGQTCSDCLAVLSEAAHRDHAGIDGTYSD